MSNWYDKYSKIECVEGEWIEFWIDTNNAIHVTNPTIIEQFKSCSSEYEYLELVTEQRLLWEELNKALTEEIDNFIIEDLQRKAAVEQLLKELDG